MFLNLIPGIGLYYDVVHIGLYIYVSKRFWYFIDYAIEINHEEEGHILNLGVGCILVLFISMSITLYIFTMLSNRFFGESSGNDVIILVSID